MAKKPQPSTAPAPAGIGPAGQAAIDNWALKQGGLESERPAFDRFMRLVAAEKGNTYPLPGGETLFTAESQPSEAALGGALPRYQKEQIGSDFVSSRTFRDDYGVDTPEVQNNALDRRRAEQAQAVHGAVKGNYDQDPNKGLGQVENRVTTEESQGLTGRPGRSRK